MLPGERIINRVSPCKCGCGGRDPWHAQHFNRVVRDVVYLDDLESVRTTAFGRDKVIARGVVKLPRGMTPVGFVAYYLEQTNEWHRLGWCVLGES